MGHMFIPSALQTQTNKEKVIKDLSLENKQLRTENDILKKEHRHLRQQIEGLEK